MEEFKNCIYDYEISNFGNVRRKLKNGEFKEVKGSVLNGGKGYKYFQVVRDQKRINYLFHVMVAKCFIGERPEGLDVDHIDRNTFNNNVLNLRYITHKENCINTDRYITDIEETEHSIRKPLVDKRYRDIQGQKLLDKKKEYYNTHKENWKDENGNWIHKRVNVTCSNCGQTRSITKSSQRQSKSDLCRRCSALNNLRDFI